ncbi:hypothetical protein GWI33_012130 [Rhynchophorus ferrugineus]|uniref:Transposable element P transposase-like RNase H domain-containing protein n=1 Tax=Rhynchophorus ferrugineus TaxID=354439 RepID=A0A834IC10_RHYFE|nr:hypothetical protein GWI33_012130 [Rhynchophorus ferrugineus]
MHVQHLSESQLIYEDVNGNDENINLNNLPSYSSAVNVISPNKEVLQEEQQSQCSIKETPRKACKSYSGIIRKFGSSCQTYLSDEFYKKVITSYKHITRNKRLVASYKTLLRQIPMRAGLNEQICLSLKSAVQNMSIVMFDEMNLAPNLQYNIKEDCIDSLENTGSYKRTAILKHLIVKVIGKCQEIGLKVLCTVCDQGSANQAGINSLLSQSRSCSEFQEFGTIC